MGTFSFSDVLFGPAPTLSVHVSEIDANTGRVVINGVDSRSPNTPFLFAWGDGSKDEGWFPMEHTYTDTTRNYIITVTARYSSDMTDSARAVVRFSPPTVERMSTPAILTVSVPNHHVTLETRLYTVPSSLTYFSDQFFVNTPRAVVEYVLTLAAWIQCEFTNGDIVAIEGGFPQVILRDPTIRGMHSLWYTSPVAVAAGDYAFAGAVQYSSLFHEIGHNFTLNTPAQYPYGGKIDGNANAIYSESLAQIFQHATAYEIINNASLYGLPEDLALEIKLSAIASASILRQAFENYLSSGRRFSSWNDPSTPQDETYGTFMTIAYKFCAHAEMMGCGYRLPLKRMMRLLQVFNSDLAARYAPSEDSAEAETFRATLLVAALSYAFSSDLRAEFRDLNFPVDDAVYDELLQLMERMRGSTIRL